MQIFAVLFLLFGFLAPQDQAAASAEKARAVLNAAIEALGGPAYLNAKDRAGGGRAFQFDRFEAMSGMARFAEFERYPDKYRQELGDEGEMVFVLNGNKAWDGYPNGVHEYTEEELKPVMDRRLLSVDIILRNRLKEPGILLHYAGTDMINGKRVDLVDFEDADNRQVTIAIEQDSHLPLRRQWSSRNPIDHRRDDETETLGSHRRISGIQTPMYRLRERNGQRIFEAFLNNYAYNVNVGDYYFRRPPGPDRKR